MSKLLLYSFLWIVRVRGSLLLIQFQLPPSRSSECALASLACMSLSCVTVASEWCIALAALPPAAASSAEHGQMPPPTYGLSVDKSLVDVLRVHGLRNSSSWSCVESPLLSSVLLLFRCMLIGGVLLGSHEAEQHIGIPAAVGLFMSYMVASTAVQQESGPHRTISRWRHVNCAVSAWGSFSRCVRSSLLLHCDCCVHVQSCACYVVCGSVCRRTMLRSTFVSSSVSIDTFASFWHRRED